MNQTGVENKHFKKEQSVCTDLTVLNRPLTQQHQVLRGPPRPKDLALLLVLCARQCPEQPHESDTDHHGLLWLFQPTNDTVQPRQRNDRATHHLIRREPCHTPPERTGVRRRVLVLSHTVGDTTREPAPVE